MEHLNNYKDNYDSLELIILKILYYCKIIISDILYIIISFIIDLLLIFFIRKKITIKKSLTFISPVVTLMFNSIKSEKKIQKSNMSTSNKRITGLIIFNGINFFILRFPLSLVSFYGLIYRYHIGSDSSKRLIYEPNVEGYIICRVFRFCDVLEDFFLLIYLNSFIFQFFILLKFDKNFQESFQDFKFRIAIKTKNILN